MTVSPPAAGQEGGVDEREVLVLAPRVVRAAAWTMLGALAIGCAGWTAGRSSGVVAVVAASMLLASVGLTLPFALQTFAPRSWTLRVADGRLWGYAAGLPVDVEFGDGSHEVRLRRLLGDLALRVSDGSHRRWVLLPVGADTWALRRAIELDGRPDGADGHADRPGAAGAADPDGSDV